jgi:protein-ribulosamine 3-kinase
MASSEYEAMKHLYAIMPEMVAEPLAWGSYQTDPTIWFYVCRYVEFEGGLPDKTEFTARLVEMHRRGVSTKGEFGFPIVTYGGRNPHWFPVTKSWEETFSRGLERTFEMEEDTHGADEDMRRLRDGIMSRVIPRLLRPLETEGREVIPTLVHGDIWDGNIAVDKRTGNPVIFDATPLYAHHECECSVHRMIDASRC